MNPQRSWSDQLHGGGGVWTHLGSNINKNYIKKNIQNLYYIYEISFFFRGLSL